MPPKSFIYVKTMFWLKFMLSSYFELCFIYIFFFNFSYLVFFFKNNISSRSLVNLLSTVLCNGQSLYNLVMRQNRICFIYLCMLSFFSNKAFNWL